MKRIAVIGTSCSGKTHFSKRLAACLDIPHVELDALYWGPDWTPRPTEELRMLVNQATAAPQWVSDGNYGSVRDVVWKRADTLVWLNYSYPIVFSRALRRTLTRCITQEKLYADNQESFYNAFLARDSFLLWVFRSYWQHRREYPVLFQSPEWSHLSVIQLKNTSDAERFLATQRRVING